MSESNVQPISRSAYREQCSTYPQHTGAGAGARYDSMCQEVVFHDLYESHILSGDQYLLYILLCKQWWRIKVRQHRMTPAQLHRCQGNVSCHTLKHHQLLLQKLSLSWQRFTRCFEREFNPSLARTGSHLLNWSVKSIRHAYVCAHSRLSPPVSLFAGSPVSLGRFVLAPGFGRRETKTENYSIESTSVD